MILTILGNLGSGKTLLMTFLGCEVDSAVYSNYNIDTDNFNLVDIEDLGEVSDGLLLIDEAYLWLESRLSSSKANRFVTKVLFQSRKRGFDVVLSAQIHSSIDLRARNLEQVTIYATGENRGSFEKYVENEEYREKVDDSDKDFHFVYFLEDGLNVKKFTLSFQQALNVVPKYDTTEFPEEIEVTKFEPDKYNEEVKEALKLIENEVGEKNLSKLAKKDIKDILLTNGIHDKQILEACHSRIKRKNLKK